MVLVQLDCYAELAIFPYSPVHTGSSVKATFDFVERIVRLVAFDNVASTLLLMWTGLNGGCDHHGTY